MRQLYNRAVKTLTDHRTNALDRHPPAIQNRNGTSYTLEGKQVVGFCGNDYLGLASEEPPNTQLSIQRVSTSASRLVSGDSYLHRTLEGTIAEWFKTEDAVVFPTGYQLNVGVMSLLIRPGDHAHSDEFNHASLIDGLRLARPTKTILPHLQRPTEHTSIAGYPEAINWWVTESTFSMDGDQTSPDEMRKAQSDGYALYVDSAHDVGLYANGHSYATASNIVPDVQVGTFGKSLGSTGAFLVASGAVCDWIRGHARSFVYSTAPSPHQAATNIERVQQIQGAIGDERRERLQRNLLHLATRLAIDCPKTPIIPIVVGTAVDAINLSCELLNRGFHVQAIRPPTVPDGTARLRLTITATHTVQEIDALVSAMNELQTVRA